MVLLLCFAVLIALVMLIFGQATYSLPALVGVSVSILAYKSVASVAGAVAIGFLGAAFAVGLGQWLAEPDRPQALRLAVALIFAAPIALGSFYLLHGLIEGEVRPVLLRVAVSLFSAAIVGASAFCKIVAPTFQPAPWGEETLIHGRTARPRH